MWHSGIDWYPGKVYMHLVYLMSQEKKKEKASSLLQKNAFSSRFCFASELQSLL